MIFCAVYTRCTEYRTLCHCSEGRTHRGRLNVTHSKSKTLEPISTADCAQIVQTSAKASKLSQKWSEIQIRISRLIRMRIRMSARSVPKCVDSSSYQHQSLRRVSVTIWEMLINLLKSSVLQWSRKWNNDPEFISGSGSAPKVNRFFRLVGPIITPSFNEIDWLLLQYR